MENSIFKCDLCQKTIHAPPFSTIDLVVNDESEIVTRNYYICSECGKKILTFIDHDLIKPTCKDCLYYTSCNDVFRYQTILGTVCSIYKKMYHIKHTENK